MCETPPAHAARALCESRSAAAHRCANLRRPRVNARRRRRAFIQQNLHRSLFQADPPLRSDLPVGESLHMTRPYMIRRIVLFLALGAWGFLLASMASFHADDWPS